MLFYQPYFLLPRRHFIRIKFLDNNCCPYSSGHLNGEKNCQKGKVSPFDADTHLAVEGVSRHTSGAKRYAIVDVLRRRRLVTSHLPANSKQYTVHEVVHGLNCHGASAPERLQPHGPVNLIYTAHELDRGVVKDAPDEIYKSAGSLSPSSSPVDLLGADAGRSTCTLLVAVFSSLAAHIMARNFYLGILSILDASVNRYDARSESTVESEGDQIRILVLQRWLDKSSAIDAQ
ncbi:hypothetical protein MY4038_007652 [Beauveria bassiana]